MRIIRKKILPEYFQEVKCGKKNFEIRRDENGIRAGDLLVLAEWNGKCYTGSRIMRQVKYVLRDAEKYGLMPGYCIIGF